MNGSNENEGEAGESAPAVAGVDGGGTRSTLVLADAAGRETARAEGPAALVDPRHPGSGADAVEALLRGALAGAGIEPPVRALCAGLAGVGNEAERAAAEARLAAAGIAERVLVVSDARAALEGAFGEGPGVLLIGGTGSAALGRGPHGAVERSGGWGPLLGDEGSAYGLARDALAAALRGLDGRGPPTALMERLPLAADRTADTLPAWAAQAEKRDVAALARVVVETAEDGDAVASALTDDAARELALHAVALARRLGPWPGEIPVVLHGGLATAPAFEHRVRAALAATALPFAPRPPLADPASGAVRLALRAAGLLPDTDPLRA